MKLNNKLKSVLVLFLSLGLVASLPAKEEHGKAKGKEQHEIHWGYTGEAGAANWGKLKPEYATCSKGENQSPVNIESAKAAAGKNKSLSLKNYKNSAVELVNNGHTIQLNFDKGSVAVINGNEYELVQMHFHSASEHTLNGQAFPMEAHLVHKNKDGQLAVIGVFMKEGKENAFLKKFWAEMPAKEGEKVKSKASGNAADFVPAKTSFYTYPGSLTTPPCSEGVLWNVADASVEASKEQIAAYNKLYTGNNRPVLPLNKRVIEKY